MVRKGNSTSLTKPNSKNMIISMEKDAKKVILEKKMDQIAQAMIDNINRHLEEKELKAREKEQGRDSSPKEGKYSSATSAKES